MQNTRRIYMERTEEINYYFEIIKPLEDDKMVLFLAKSKSYTQISKKEQFFKILKSNFLLMLYNLVESTIINGLLEIYEKIKENDCSYQEVIDEIQDIWINWKIRDVYGNSSTKLITYKNKIKEMILCIANNTPIDLSKNSLDIKGNLDARKIRQLCDEHRIICRMRTKGEKLLRVKSDRNKLAHGDVSFSDCARDLTVNDLEKMKDDVFLFLEDVLDGMQTYYNRDLYKRR